MNVLHLHSSYMCTCHNRGVGVTYLPFLLFIATGQPTPCVNYCIYTHSVNIAFYCHLLCPGFSACHAQLLFHWSCEGICCWNNGNRQSSVRGPALHTHMLRLRACTHTRRLSPLGNKPPGSFVWRDEIIVGHNMGGWSEGCTLICLLIWYLWKWRHRRTTGVLFTAV